MLQSDLHAEARDKLLETAIAEVDGELYLVNPTRETMREFVSTYGVAAEPPAVSLFVDPEPLKELVDDFLIASSLADLVEDDSVSVRTLDAVPRHSLLLGKGVVVSLVEVGDQVCGLTTTDESFVTATNGHYESRWEEAEKFTLRTPALSRVMETLEEEIGPEVAADFDRILETLETARGGGQGLDEVTIALLVAARHRELLYDISRWGEDIRLASKATFSRSKNQLEDSGLIDTEKVPIDVGRPRLRLMLGSEELRDATIEEVAERAKDALG